MTFSLFFALCFHVSPNEHQSLTTSICHYPQFFGFPLCQTIRPRDLVTSCNCPPLSFVFSVWLLLHRLTLKQLVSIYLSLEFIYQFSVSVQASEYLVLVSGSVLIVYLVFFSVSVIVLQNLFSVLLASLLLDSRVLPLLANVFRKFCGCQMLSQCWSRLFFLLRQCSFRGQLGFLGVDSSSIDGVWLESSKKPRTV